MSRATYYRLLAVDVAADTAPQQDPTSSASTGPQRPQRPPLAPAPKAAQEVLATSPALPTSPPAGMATAPPADTSKPCVAVSNPTLQPAPDALQEGVQASASVPAPRCPETALAVEVQVKTPRKIARKLSPQEQQEVLALLTQPRFVDKAPRAIWAILLEEGRYLCHWRTMYRLLHKLGPVIDRRPQRRHPSHKPPELVASAPNQVWSWDITYLTLTEKQGFVYLYTILDIYSRCVVGWTLHTSECGEVAAEMVKQTCERHQIKEGQLTLHADRGAPMKSRPLGELVEKLGVSRSHSRPRVSNDNAFVESFFKTAKYSANYPKTFENEEEARVWVREFMEGYNNEHRHSALGLLTPAQVHLGKTEEIQEKRRQVLTEAREAHPLRFGRREPTLPGPAAQVRLGPVPTPPQPGSEAPAS